MVAVMMREKVSTVLAGERMDREVREEYRKNKFETGRN